MADTRSLLMELALFDFDGTITRGDTTFSFIRFFRGTARLYIGVVALFPMFLLYRLKVITHHRAKDITLAYFFGGCDRDELIERANAFAREILPRMIRPAAVEKIRWHRERKHTIAVVTGSLDILVGEWCREHGAELICTRLDMRSSRISGHIDGTNCFKEEKARRIREQYRLDEFEKIYAYGDSSGDRYMFDLAHEIHFKPFH